MNFFIARFLLCAFGWLLLTGNDPDAWAVGAAGSAAAAALSLRLLPPRTGLHHWRSWRSWRSWRALAMLAGEFFSGSLRGGFDVAWRALHPRLPVRPGWVRHRLHLSAGPRRMLLGDLLSLMPGSLAAGQAGEQGEEDKSSKAAAGRPYLWVHCLDTGPDVARQLRRQEARVRAVLGEPAGDRHTSHG